MQSKRKFSSNKLYALLLLISIISLSNSYTCSFSTNNSQVNCILYFSSSQQNCSSQLQFISCQFNDLCLNQSTVNSTCLDYSRINSLNQNICNDQCNSTSSTATSIASPSPLQEGLLIFGVLLGAVFLLLVCIWVMRKYCSLTVHRTSNSEQQNQMRIQYPDHGAQSERRLSKVPPLDENNNWMDYDPSIDILPSQQQICVICLDTKTNAYLSCGHGFHCLCIKEWLNRKENCPLCKVQKMRQIRLLCLSCRKRIFKCMCSQLKSLAIIQKCHDCQNKHQTNE